MANTKKNTNKTTTYKSVAAMLCGKKLTENQKKDIEQYNKAYDEAHEKKIAKNSEK